METLGMAQQSRNAAARPGSVAGTSGIERSTLRSLALGSRPYGPPSTDGSRCARVFRSATSMASFEDRRLVIWPTTDDESNHAVGAFSERPGPDGTGSHRSTFRLA